jgi:pSer/pThr/pTyr-binding forkhead associated (FHA) protein
MKLKSLFAKLISPKKNGDSGLGSSGEGKNFQYHLQATNIEGQPTYPLTDFLAVGSEVGDVVLDDPSLSAKHCTFFLKDNVISIIDHNSVEGTFINDKKISSGKMIILQDGDYVRAGELEFDILKHAIEATPAQEQTQDAPVSTPPSDDLILETQSPQDAGNLDLSLDSSFEKHVETQAPSVSSPDRTQDINPQLLKSLAPDTKEQNSDLQEKTSELKPGFFARLFKRKVKNKEAVDAQLAVEDEEKSQEKIDKKDILHKNKSKKNKGFGKFSTQNRKVDKLKVKALLAKEPLANSLVRVLALMMDILIVAGLVVITMPYSFLDQYSAELETFVIAQYNELLLPHIHLYIDQYRHYIDLVLKVINPLKPFFKYYYLFVAYRLICALLLSKTFGQLFMGIRSSEKFLWSRLGGFLREIWAVIFLPLMPLFDAPLIVGIKSLKEGLSFTRLELRKSGLAWLGGVIFLPLCLAFLLISPLMMGFELNIDKTQEISDKKINAQQGAFNAYSEYLTIKMITGDLAPLVDVSLDVEMKAGQTYLVPYLAIQQEQKTFNLTLRESFKISDLIQKMEMFDYFFSGYYPTLSNYSHEVGEHNPNFSRKILKGKDLDVFKTEFKDYLTRSLNLNLIGLESHVPERGPFLLGHVLVKRWLLEKSQLIDIQKIFYIDLQDIPYLALAGTNESNGREVVLMPLINEQGLIYVFSLPKDLPMVEALDQLEKNILPYMTVARQGEDREVPASGKFLVFDMISDLINEISIKNQDTENLFHEKLSSILSVDRKLFETCLKIVDYYIKHFTEQRSADAENKENYENLLKYLNQAKDAIENQDSEFFEIIKNS